MRHRPVGVGDTKPSTQGLDLGTVGRSLRADQILADTRHTPKRIASVTRTIAEAASNQHVDLAAGELVQPGGLHDPQPDRRVGSAEEVEAQAGEIETGIDAQGQYGGDSLWLEPLCRFGDAVESFLHGCQVFLPRGSQDKLLMQPLEQTHAEAVFQGLHSLPDGTRRDVQLTRSELKAQMPRCGLECAQRVQWWQKIGHGAAIMTELFRKLATDFLRQVSEKQGLPLPEKGRCRMSESVAVDRFTIADINALVAIDIGGRLAHITNSSQARSFDPLARASAKA
jgi:hypothetical protein